MGPGCKVYTGRDDRTGDFFSKEIERGKGTRGRGAEGKQNVAVMAESTLLEDIVNGTELKVKESTAWSGIAWSDDAIVFSDKSNLTSSGFHREIRRQNHQGNTQMGAYRNQ